MDKKKVEWRDRKTNQIQIPELKNAMNEMKNAIESIIIRVDHTEEFVY